MKREREQELIASLQLAHKISLEEAKKQLGVLLALVGMLLVFLCLPMEFLLIALGLALTITGLWLLGD